MRLLLSICILILCSIDIMAQSHKSLFKKGQAAYNAGSYAEASKYFEQAIAKNQGKTPISTQSKVNYYNYSGTTHVLLGNYEEAISHLSWAIDNRQEMVSEGNNQYRWVPLASSSDYFWRGRAHYSLQNYLLAIDDFQVSIDEDASSTWAYYYMSECLLATENFPEAIKNFNLAISKGLKNGLTYNAKGRAYYKSKNYSQALLNYKKAYQADTKDISNLAAQGMPLAYMGQLDKSLDVIDQALAKDTNQTGYFYFMQSRVYGIFGKSNESISSLKKAFENGFKNWDALSIYYEDFGKVNRHPKFMQILIDNDAMVGIMEKSANSKVMADLQSFRSNPDSFSNITEPSARIELAEDSGFTKKVALIIGNSEYKDAPLRNTLNDALLMANELKSLGFKVNDYYNLDKSDLRKAIRDFSQDLEGKNDLALFYYAGHGLQSGGTNFLVPINADVESDFEIEDECVKVNSVLRMLESVDNKMNIVIMDACRNNPFGSVTRSLSQSGGLVAPETSPKGTIIAFATSPGKTASDGEGSNGLYTQELVRAMRIPGLTIEEVFKRVRINVLQKSSQKQNPWENSSLVGDFYFRPE